ncbi:MAG TPA: hypothetical protein VIJ99_06935 [Acidimicrobiales bacterium]
MTTEPPNSSRRLESIRAGLDRKARRTLRSRLVQLPVAIVLVGGLIFAMAAGGAFDRHPASYLPSQNATSSRNGGTLGLKIDAVLTGLYLVLVVLTYTLRRLSAPYRARRALARESVV